MRYLAIPYMFMWWHAWQEERKLRGQVKAINKESRKLIRALAAEGRAEAIPLEQHRRHKAIQEVFGEYARTTELLVLWKADKLTFPFPIRTNVLNFGTTMGLSDKGRRHLRDQIRKETKERNDLILSWLSPIIQLITALTGLFAVLIYGFKK